MPKTIKKKLQDVKRELILEEAAKWFESVGYEDVKVSDLAKNVGVSVGTIYGLFDSKEGLYFAYVRHQIAKYVQTLEKQMEKIAEPEKQLRAVFEMKFGVMAAKRRAVEECVYNNPLFFSNVRHNTPDLLGGVYVLLSGIIARINPALGAEEAEKLAYAFVGLSDGYVSHWLYTDGDLLARLDTMHSQMLTMIKGC